jgi:hypothetical protein
MNFHNRQYDPQLGRFLSIDPLAASGVQSRYSPYAAMGDNPAILVDPDGLKFAYPVLLTGRAEHSRVIAAMEAEVEYKQNGRLNDMSRHLSVGGMDWGGGRSNFVRMGVLEQFAMAVLAAGGQVLVATGNAGVDRNDNSGGVGGSGGSGNDEEKIFKQVQYEAVTINEPGTDNKTIVESKGLLMIMLYVGMESYSEYQWFQMVETTHPAPGKSSPYIDNSKESPFFYVTPTEMPYYTRDAKALGGKFMIYDQPSRDSRIELTWSATTTLVGRNSSNGAWSVVGSFSWGWSMSGGTVTVTPWQQVSTPWTIINQINIYNANNKLKSLLSD